MTKSRGSTEHAVKVWAPLIAPPIRSLLGTDATVGPDESIVLTAEDEDTLAAAWDEEARRTPDSAPHTRRAKRTVTKNGQS